MSEKPPSQDILKNDDIQQSGNNSSTTDTTLRADDVGTIEAPQTTEVEQTETPEQRKAARNYRWRIIMGVLLPSILEAFDSTIIAAALSFIASDFEDLSQLSWVANAFNITACAFVPAFGQLADLFGRYPVLQACSILILIGSALAAGAQEYVMLLFGRALQGVGCAGVLVLVRVILADRVSLAENTKNTSIYTFVAGSAYTIGPVVGGYLTEVNWRWVFIINAPIGVVGMVVAWWLLRKVLVGPKEDAVGESQSPQSSKSTLFRKLSQIDIGGQIIFLAGTTLFNLAIVWGGATHPWKSANVISPLIIGTLLLLVFPVYEYYMTPGKAISRLFPQQTAMIPFRVLATRNISLLCFINFSTGMAMYAVLFFASIYFTIVGQFTASESGIRLLFYLPGIAVGSVTAMHLCLVRPRNTFSALFSGSVIEAIGITILIYAFYANNLPVIYAMMAFTGVGTGMRFMPGTLHGVGFFPDTVAPVISLSEFSLFFGGTIALPLMNSVFNNKLTVPGSSIHFDSHASSLEAIAALPEDVQKALRERAGVAVMWAFVAVCPIMWVAVAAAACLGTVYLDKDGQTLRAEGEGGDAIRSKRGVVEGAYLVDLYKRYGPGKKRTVDTSPEPRPETQ